MPNVLDVAPTASGTIGGYYLIDTRDSSIAVGSSIAVEPDQDFADPPPPRRDNFYSYAGAAVSPVTVHLPETPVPVPSVDLNLVSQSKIAAFVARVRSDLEQEVRLAKAEQDRPDLARALRACISIARVIAPNVALDAQVRSAAFVEEDDEGVSLVVQSLSADRRINIEISGLGEEIDVHSIDERMQSKHFSVSRNSPQAIQELAEWVRGRV